MSRYRSIPDWIVRHSLSAPSSSRFIWFGLGSLGIFLLVFAFLAWNWRFFTGFQVAIDTCTAPFCDFTTFYYPMGKAVLFSGTPVKGFMYSPFIALTLAVFSPLEIQTSILIWGILQTTCVVLYLLLFRWLVPAGKRFQLLFSLLALTSFPLWHNLSWGQVGIITTVAILGMLALLQRGHHLSPAVLVSFAAGFKFYPLIFLAPFAFRRDIRFLLLVALACAAIFIFIPCILMGSGDMLTFYRGLIDSFRASEWVVNNYNSQHFPHVLLRISDALRFTAHPYLPLFKVLSFSLAAFSLMLIYRIQRASLPLADLWGVHLLFLSIPFFLKTSWPVDLVYISFAQAFLAWQIMAGERIQQVSRNRLWRGIMLMLLAISIGISNMDAFNLIGNYRAYGYLGFIFWADLLCLLVSFILLIPLVRTSSNAELF